MDGGVGRDGGEDLRVFSLLVVAAAARGVVVSVKVLVSPDCFGCVLMLHGRFPSGRCASVPL